MKRTLMAATVLAACCVAHAQSSVTIFGVMDAGVARISGTGTGHATGVVSGGHTTGRFGFRGTEDLGGGLWAGFWLEGQLNNDVGGGATQTTGMDFQRRSTVSLGGPFGEIRLGRDLTATDVNLIAFDTWSQRGIGQVNNLGPTAGGVNSYARNNNTVAYVLPQSLGGLYGMAQYTFGERSSNTPTIANAAGISTSAANATTDKTGNYLGGRLGYAGGALDIAGTLGRYQDAVRTTGIAAAPFYAGNYDIANLGASWDFGVIKPRLFVQTEKVDGRGAAPDFKLNTYVLGATAPLGPGLLRAQIVRYDNKTSGQSGNDASQFAVGYAYNLSKRTSLYAEVSRLDNKGSATYMVNNLSASLAAPAPLAGGKSTGYIVGVKHVF